MNDRRRINPPSGGTAPPVFTSTLSSSTKVQPLRPARIRKPDEPRKIFLKTGITPSASGSAYLELAPTPQTKKFSPFLPPTSSLKISCTVHGPHPLLRSAPYNSSLALTTTVKFAPFATRYRRGYVRDAAERDLSVHLETALRGVIIGERWPKSGVDVIITVLEGEEDRWWGDEAVGASAAATAGGWGLMSVLAGAITASSAALVDAGIDCVDLVSGGVAAVVEDVSGQGTTILDPVPAEHQAIAAACVVGYLAERDEVTELWIKGDAGVQAGELLEKAIEAAVASRAVLTDAVMEAAKTKFPDATINQVARSGDVEMVG